MEPTGIRIGALILQPGRQLLRAGKPVFLRRKPLQLLSALAEAGGQVLTKDELLERVWPSAIVEENALQAHIVAVRKALGTEADRLKTVYGIGYELELDEEGVAGSAPLPAMQDPDDLRPSSVSDSENRARDRAGAVQPPLSGARSGPAPHVPGIRKRGWAGLRRNLLFFLAPLLLAIAGWAIFYPSSDNRIPIVVQPLSTSGAGGPNEAALANGITDELIIRLGRLPRLQVAAAEGSASATSGAFEHAYVVDGAIRSDGDLLRVTARLSNPDGEVLWSENFDRRLAGRFEVQEAIAASIADALSVSFSQTGETTELSRRVSKV